MGGVFLFLAGSAHLAGGCGGDDVCARAVARADACYSADAAMPSGAPTAASSGPPPSCSGAYQCSSNCVNGATCGAITGADANAAADYLTCLAGCETN